MSTLLSDLDSSPPSSKDGDLVEQILHEMNGGSSSSGFPPNQGVISAPMSNTVVNSHIMDSAPATAHMIGNTQPTPADFAAAMHAVPYTPSIAAPQQQQQQPSGYKSRNSLFQRFTDEFKPPLLVAVLVFVFSLPVINFLFAHYLPSMVLPTGQLTMVGLLIKSLVAGGTFWVLQRIVVPLFSR